MYWVGAAVAEWLSSWLAGQEDRGSIPGLATRIFRDWLSPASNSRYGWKIAKSTLILKTTNQPTTNMYWVLFVGLLDLRQGLTVLKSSLFSIIWHFVGHGVKNFVLGSCGVWWRVGGDDTLWGVWPSSGGWVGNYGDRSGRAGFKRWCTRDTAQIQRVLIGDRFALQSEWVILYPIIPDQVMKIGRVGRLSGVNVA